MKKYSSSPFVPIAFDERFSASKRKHQGIPSFEILPSGRMFCVWYAGELKGEGPGNYVVLASSSNQGLSWKEIQVVAPTTPEERAFDSILWLDPLGRLWWLWAQSMSAAIWDIFDGKGGVWATICENPDTDFPEWSTPRRIADGVQMCRPTVLSDGSWAFPAAVWTVYKDKLSKEMKEIAFSNLLITKDQGESFSFVKGPNVIDRVYDEHMLIENRDLSWTVYVRTKYGIGCSTSKDQGKTWSRCKDSRLGGANSRVAIRRLKSGRILLVNNETPQLLPGERRGGAPRTRLTAWLSDDYGKKWYGKMLIDERNQVSYPDIAENDDGFIYVTYDHDRMNHGQILLTRFTETDVKAGEYITPGSYSRLLINAF